MRQEMLSPKGIQEKEDAELLAEFFKMHPEYLTPPVVHETDSLEVEILCAKFEARHSLDALQAIDQVSPVLEKIFANAADIEDQNRIKANVAMLSRHGKPGAVKKYIDELAGLKASILALPEEEKNILKIRREAQRDLVAFTKLIPTMSRDAKDRYLVISRAVGVLSNGRIDHERGK